MLSLIVAASDNDVIGRANALPWQLSRDLKNFKEVTTGHAVVMGRKTYESIFARLGKPLPNRKNIVVTQQQGFQAPDCTVVHSLEEAFKAVPDEEVFVIGGEAMYRLALPLVDRLYITRVHAQIEGDVKLPAIDFSEWKVVHEEIWPKDEKNEYDATYQIYERKR